MGLLASHYQWLFITLSMASVLYTGVKRWNSPFLRSELFLSSSPKLFFDPGFIIVAIIQGHQSQASDSTVVVELGYSTQGRGEARQKRLVSISHRPLREWKFMTNLFF